MSNGNTEVIREIKKILDEGKPLDIETRDRLLFSAVIDIYNQLEIMQPVVAFYKVGMFVASAIGVGILGVIGGLLTGKIELIFR